MPRSNKKKISHKAVPIQPLVQSTDGAISNLLEKEKTLMISRTITSGKKHGIDLQHGSSNPGTGNCSFESILQNNNDRKCFPVKFPMSVNYYRRIWMTDMANRTINTELNIYSNQEWMAGWEQLLIPGTYERGIFGDLMLPGIACGVKKFLLIFNTNTESPHDPIYIVDPRQFNVNPDSDIPIVLSYNLSHYESIHPCTDKDIKATVNLVREYLGGSYRFGKKDLPFLLGLESDKSRSNKEDINQNYKIDFLNIQNSKEHVMNEDKQQPTNSNKRKAMSNKDIDENPKKKSRSDKNNITTELTDEVHQRKLSYKLKSKELTHQIEEVEGKMKCPICTDIVKNIQKHFQKKRYCGSKIDQKHFLPLYEIFIKERRKYQQQRSKEKAKIKNPEIFAEQNKASAKKSQDKSRAKNPEIFAEQNKASAKKSKDK